MALLMAAMVSWGNMAGGIRSPALRAAAKRH